MALVQALVMALVMALVSVQARPGSGWAMVLPQQQERRCCLSHRPRRSRPRPRSGPWPNTRVAVDPSLNSSPQDACLAGG
jgi:hypothetical protein